MTYLVVGLDQSTSPRGIRTSAPTTWHRPRRIAFARAQAAGIQLVVAAVIGPGLTVLAEPAQARARWSEAA